MFYKINIDNGKKIDDFIKILKENDIQGALVDEINEPNFKVQSTILGGLSSLEWREVYLKTNDDRDIKELIKDYII